MSATGLGPGSHKLSNVEVCVANDRATVVGTNTLAGSIIEMDACVSNFAEFTGCSLAEAIDAATIVNARLLGIESTKGSLAAGKDADLVIFKKEVDALGKLRCVLTHVFHRHLCNSSRPAPTDSLPSRLRVVCTIVSGEIAYQEPELDWQVNIYLSVAFAFAVCQAAFCVSTHVSLIRRVAGHAGLCACDCEYDTTRRFDIGSKSYEECAGRGPRNLLDMLIFGE